jgi:transposase
MRLTARSMSLNVRSTAGSVARRSVTGLPRSLGSGRLTATAVVATVADAPGFRSEREFAAFLGLVHQQARRSVLENATGVSLFGVTYLKAQGLEVQLSPTSLRCWKRNRRSRAILIRGA